MNITQMAQALKGLPKFDFIFADCCHMMTAEVGYELRDVTSYLIGSPSEFPGYGAPYDVIIPQLFKNGRELYRGIIDTYYNYYMERYIAKKSRWEGYSVPLSVIDTRYMGQLAQATRDVLSLFTGGYPQYPETPNLQNLVYYCGIDVPFMYDMRALIKRNTPEAVFQSWDKVYQQAVPYYRMSMRWMTVYNGLFGHWNLIGDFPDFDQDESLYGCLSMYIPRNTESYNGGDYQYNKTANNFGWNRIIDWSRFGWN